MRDTFGGPDQVVGVRFERCGPVTWYRVGDVPAAVRSWVVAERAGVETVGRVIVGRGQCLEFPGDPSELPGLLREADAEEVPPPLEGGGRRLLESLPRPSAYDPG